MHRHKLRTLSQDSEHTLRSAAETPVLTYSSVKVPKYKEVIAPFVRKKSRFLKEFKKLEHAHSQTGTIERAKVQIFLNSRKQIEQSQYLNLKRDISHLKDKGLSVSNSAKDKSFNAFGIPVEGRTRPGIEELAEIGKNECCLFPKVCWGEKKGAVLDKEWICVKELKGGFGRQEAGNLKNWFDEMKKKIWGPNVCSEGLVEVKGLVLVTIKELYSQISVQCNEHGKIFIELLEIYSKLIDKFTGFNTKTTKVKISKNFEVVQEKLKTKIQSLKAKIQAFEVEKQNFLEKETFYQSKIQTLQEDLSFQKELVKNPIRRRTSIGLNNTVYSLSKFADNLKKKFGEIGGLYDNIVEIKPEREPYHIRISSYESMQPEPIESEVSFSSMSSGSSRCD